MQNQLTRKQVEISKSTVQRRLDEAGAKFSSQCPRRCSRYVIERIAEEMGRGSFDYQLGPSDLFRWDCYPSVSRQRAGLEYTRKKGGLDGQASNKASHLELFFKQSFRSQLLLQGNPYCQTVVQDLQESAPANSNGTVLKRSRVFETARGQWPKACIKMHKMTESR